MDKRRFTEPAHVRALRKARDHGFVMIYGSFSGERRELDDDHFDTVLPHFDRRKHIERLIADGLLRPARFFNQYECTSAGLQLLANFETVQMRALSPAPVSSGR